MILIVITMVLIMIIMKTITIMIALKAKIIEWEYCEIIQRRSGHK